MVRLRGVMPLLLTLLVLVSISVACGQSASNARRLASLTRQADKGDIRAQNELGHMYYMGDGVQVDYSKAQGWFRKAAEKGNADSQFMLGGLYHFGQSVPHDEAKAFDWIMKAAKQGHGDAEFYISTCYSQDGWGVRRDSAQRIAWLRKGAGDGNLNSQFYLGMELESGNVVPKDYSESYFWLALAAAANVWDREKLADIVRLRDYSQSHLTQSELSNVQTHLQKWVKDHPNKEGSQ